MEEDKKETVFYICPNSCENPSFHWYGVSETTQILSETGEEMKLKTYDFTPDEGQQLRCRTCDTPAVKKRRVTTTTVEMKNW